ncbi:MAG: hypothetical protein JWN59_1425 [Sphingomonas bacterium]|jgi:hypothetical protein|nr:hypothetical protein [Sphingomonas bacterium]
MTQGSLLLMALIGLVALLSGAALLLTAPRRASDAARYVSRLGGVMLGAIGLILIVFAASWVLMV